MESRKLPAALVQVGDTIETDLGDRPLVIGVKHEHGFAMMRCHFIDTGHVLPRAYALDRHILVIRKSTSSGSTIDDAADYLGTTREHVLALDDTLTDDAILSALDMRELQARIETSEGI